MVVALMSLVLLAACISPPAADPSATVGSSTSSRSTSTASTTTSASPTTTTATTTTTTTPRVEVPGDITSLTIPAGSCGAPNGDGWVQSEPIQLRGGEGESFPSSDPEAAGASILEIGLVGTTDLTGDGTDEAIVWVSCSGSRIAQCCAGRASVMDVVLALDLTGPQPQRVGESIWPVEVTDSSGSEQPRSFIGSDVRLDGRSVVTHQSLIYDSPSLTASERQRLEGTVTYDLVGGTWQPR